MNFEPVGGVVTAAEPNPLDCSLDGVVDSADVECATADTINEILAAARLLPGDFNLNGEVNILDFLTLSRNFGDSVTSYTEGDADLNRVVDIIDFLALSRNFNKPRPESNAVTVPETSPPAWLLPCIFLGPRVWKIANETSLGLRDSMSPKANVLVDGAILILFLLHLAIAVFAFGGVLADAQFLLAVLSLLLFVATCFRGPTHPAANSPITYIAIGFIALGITAGSSASCKAGRRDFPGGMANAAAAVHR